MTLGCTAPACTSAYVVLSVHRAKRALAVVAAATGFLVEVTAQAASAEAD